MFRLIILIILMSPFLGPSQTTLVDSLSKEVDQSTGSKKIELLFELGYVLDPIDSLGARNLADQGIDLAAKSNELELVQSGKLLHAFIDHSHGMTHSLMDRSLEVLHSGVELLTDDSAMVIGLIGSALTELGAYEMAIDYRKQLIDLNNRYDRDNPYYPVENLAFLFSEMHQYDSAHLYYNQALDIATKLNVSVLEIHCLNNMGYNYYVQNNLLQAEIFYDLALKSFGGLNQTHQDTIMYGVVLGNLADISSDKADYQSALTYSLAADPFLADRDHRLWTQNKLRLAQVKLDLELLPEAKTLLDTCFKLISDHSRLELVYYGTLAEYHNRSGNQTLAFQTLTKKLKIAEIIANRRQMDSKINDLVQFQTNRIKTELNLQRKLRGNQERIASLKMQLIVGISALVLIILFILFIKYRSDNNRKFELTKVEIELNKMVIQNQKIEQVRLQSVLEHKNKDLTDFAIDITRKHEFAEDLLKRLKHLKKTSTEKDASINELLIYTKNQLIIDKNMKIFQENVDRVNHEFLTSLLEKFPELTGNEQQLCSLLRLQLSSKEIATIKGISPDSVKVLRSRLRKKLDLSPDTDLQKFVTNLK